METFYRVQDSKGTGPYQNYDNSRMRLRHDYDHRRPTPSGSGGYYMDAEEICGFRTMQALYAWFGGWLPGLIKKGYRVAKVTGIATYEDDYQVVFRPE